MQQFINHEKRTQINFEKFFIPMVGAILGFISGVPIPLIADAICLQLYNESVLSHPLGVVGTACIYIATTGLGAIAGNEYRKWIHRGIKPSK